ncbi:hypothetical protein [Amycolatopsis sp.]|jgi:hypothetical protein|uniref:hypothetical protein n=1 Tax=Amycolatopsis sp. TaxID=37632 RepID=UPI002E0C0712|nr:hypothetical protein [Amycolatopsis sp.]
MKVRQKIAAYATALLALTGALTLAAPQAASAAGIDSCDLSKKVNELRGWDTNGKYNIVVWQESARQHSRFNGIVIQGHATARQCAAVVPETVHYFWVVFRDGEFTRKGDGGYRNWAFFGRWNRNDKYVKFLPR